MLLFLQRIKNKISQNSALLESTQQEAQVKHLFTKKEIWNLIWPLIIEQLLAITLGIADIIMVSTLGEEAVSGVSLVDTIFIFINQLLAALATGGAVVCSQYIGKKQSSMASKAALQLIYSVCALSLLVAVICFFCTNSLLSFLFGNIDASVMSNAKTYFFWTLVGLPSVALYNACASLFRAQRNSRVSMFTGLLINILNIGGNAIMLYGLHMGVEGVAIPTFISRTTAAIILLILLHKPQSKLKNKDQVNSDNQISIQGLHKVHFDFYLIKKILQIGIPNGLENSMFQLGKILVLTLVTTFGTGAIAANAASNTIAGFEVLPGSAIGLALLTIIGQCMGAGKPEEAVYYTKKLLLTAYVSMIILNVPLLLCSKALIGLYGMSEETTHLGYQMLMCHGLLGMILWPSAFTLPNALRAANDAKYTMIVSLISMWTIRIGCSYLYANTFGLGALGPWLAMSTDWFFRGLFFILRFKSGRWKNKRLV